jgi:predicted DCC family thiol-disulfide oxidoreductase YuxK
MSSMGALTIVYDGDCPVCRNYVRFLRIKETVGTVTLLDARDGGPLVDQLMQQGVDLDDGMALIMGSQLYHGSDCVNKLALMSTSSGAFNRLNAWLFQSTWRSRVLYPVMRAGRNLLLKMLNKKSLAKSDFYNR